MIMHRRRNPEGFTLVELLVAMAMAIVVLGAMFFAFKSQQDSYVVQSQVTTMQQSVRGAMYMLVRDVQMAGYYSSFDRDTYDLDWNDLDSDSDTGSGTTEDIRPLLCASNDLAVGGDNIRDGTDVLVVVKCSADVEELGANDSATGTTITLNDLTVGTGDGEIDLNDQGKRFGMVVKADLSRSEFFEIVENSGGTAPFTVTASTSFDDDYMEGDFICKADVIIYRIDDQEADNPRLMRKNLGSDNGYQLVAEDIENLQIRYQLDDGTWVNDPDNPPTYTAANVRAVEVSLLARTNHTIREWTDSSTYTLAGVAQGPYNDSYRRKLMCTIIETRNIGL